jgi:hypothetical protein
MEIGSYPVLLDPTPLASRQGSAVGAAGRPVPPPSVEPVLQGELLQRQQAAGQQPRKSNTTWTVQRREDHPAFQSRYANDAYQQRRAIGAYQTQAAAAQASARQGASVDYFA